MSKERTLLCISCSKCPTIDVNKHLLLLNYGRVPAKESNLVVSQIRHIAHMLSEPYVTVNTNYINMACILTNKNYDYNDCFNLSTIIYSSHTYLIYKFNKWTSRHCLRRYFITGFHISWSRDSKYTCLLIWTFCVNYFI